jgi:pilus assembly protein FimV
MRSFFSSKAILLLLAVLLSALSLSFDLYADNTRIRGPKNVDVGEQGKRYGPVRDSDTLWRIATKLRPDDSVTIYQVMQAIFQKNPDSFLDNNINHLRTGSYLRMPSMREIRSINPGFAQERSELDDKLWDKKVKGEMSQAEIDVVAKQAEQAKKQDVIVAKKELSEEIKQAKQAQTEQLEQLKDEFKSSVNNVEANLTENENLKNQVSSLSNELELIRGQLDSDRQTLNELKALLADQHRILAEQEAKAKADAESFSLQNLTNNPLLLVLLALIPGFLIVGGAIYWFKSRATKPEPEEPIFNTSSATIPDPIVNDNLTGDLTGDLDDALSDGLDEPLDDELTATLDDPFDDALEQNFDNALDDDIVALDDSLDDALDAPDDLLYEDEEPALENTNSLLDQDELDGLLGDALDEDGSDDLVPEMESEPADDGLLDADDIDAILAQDFDSPIDNDDESDDIAIDDIISNESEIELDIPEEFEPSSEDSADVADVDAIMDELSNDDADLSQNVNDDNLPDDLEEEEKEPEIQLDMDDIDAMIDEVESDDIDLTDLDALLEEANSDAERLAAQQAAAEAFANTDTSEQDLDVPLETTENIDGSEVSETLETNDELDDIDALLDDASEASDDDVDLDDLLDASADLSELPADETAEDTSLEDSIDDSLLDELAPQSEAVIDDELLEALDEEPTSEVTDESELAVDEVIEETSLEHSIDNDSLLDEVEPQNEAAIEDEILESEIDSDLVDIHSTESKEPASESVEDEDISDQLIDDIALPEDIAHNDTLESDLDDQLISEESVDFGDDPLAIDVDLAADDEPLLDQFDNDEQHRADTPSQTLDEYPELELDEALEQIDAPAFNAEEPLPEIEKAQEINEEVITTEDLSTAEQDDFLDDDIISSDLDNSNDLLINELESTDFDSLLNELAEPEPISPESQKDFELDFDSLLSEQTDAEPFEVEEIDTAESDYLDIDDLLEESDEADADVEPYQNADMDVGLGDFEDLLAGEDSLDVDMESQGFSAKLDLARAYLEINDSESALKVIDEVISNGPPEVQDEAQALKQQLS